MNGYNVLASQTSTQVRIILTFWFDLKCKLQLDHLSWLEEICVTRWWLCCVPWRSLFWKMKVNNSEVECLTISLRGLIHDGESNMHIKHISRLFILLQTRLKEPAEHLIILILLFRFCVSYKQQVLPPLENLIEDSILTIYICLGGSS